MEGIGAGSHRHVCSSECDSIHKHIVSKLFLTLKEGRPEFIGKKGEEPIRHLASSESPPSEPRRSLNKWFHLGLFEDEVTRTMIRDAMMRGSTSYRVNFKISFEDSSCLALKCLSNNRQISLKSIKDILLESWTINMQLSETRSIDLTELYKQIIVLMRSVYTVMRQLPINSLIKELKKTGPYQDIPVKLQLSILPFEEIEWFVLPGTEQYEQCAEIKFSDIKTAHGTLSLNVEYRNQIDIKIGQSGQSSSILKDSFESLTKPETIVSPKSSIKSRPSSFSSSPGLKLGMGVSGPRRAVSQPTIASPEVISLPPRLRTSSVLTANSPPSSKSNSISQSIYLQMSPSVLEDTAITQFMKQCENHPELDSFKLSSKDVHHIFFNETNMQRKVESLKDQLSDMEKWISDFRAAESLQSPTVPRRAANEASIIQQSKMQVVSPVMECQTPPPANTEASEDEYHLMFPL